MEEPVQGRPASSCAACGGARVTWRVKRLRASGRGVSHVTLQLDCRDCGATWDEALEPGRSPPEGDGLEDERPGTAAVSRDGDPHASLQGRPGAFGARAGEDHPNGEQIMADRDLTQRGAENSAEGKADNLMGKVKDAVGGLTGDASLQGEGKLDQLKGKVQDAFGKGQRKAGDGL
jgi:uncharacterized protein YjbJ (UPF0337 family)